MAGNFNNGYIHPITQNVTRAKAVKSGGTKMSTKASGTQGEAVKNRAKVSKNLTPKTQNPVKHSAYLPKQVNSVSKNVGNAPARGFGR